MKKSSGLIGLVCGGVLGGALLLSSVSHRGNELVDVPNTYSSLLTESSDYSFLLDNYVRKLESYRRELKSRGEVSSYPFVSDLLDLEKLSEERDFDFKFDFDSYSFKGNPRLVVREVYRNLTRRDFPEGLEIVPSNFEECKYLSGNVVGCHVEKENKIYYEENVSPLLAINYLMHELGHVAYPVSERADEASKSSFEVASLEEAGAYLFTLSGINWIHTRDSELASKLYELHTRSRDLCFVYVPKNEEHKSGLVLAQATLNYFNNDSERAFNYLLDKDSFSRINPRILSLYETLMRDADEKKKRVNLDAKELLMDFRKFRDSAGIKTRTLQEMIGED